MSGDKVITWNDYFEAYNKLCKLLYLKESSESSLIIKAVLSRPLKWVLRLGRKHFERHLFELYQELQIRSPKLARKVDSLFRGSIQPEEFKFFKPKSRFSIGKARSLLGFNPEYSFEKGIEITGK